MPFSSFFFHQDLLLCPLDHNEFLLFLGNFVILRFFAWLFLLLDRLDLAFTLFSLLFVFPGLPLYAVMQINAGHQNLRYIFVFPGSLLNAFHLLFLTCFPLFEECAHFYENVCLDVIVGLVLG